MTEPTTQGALPLPGMESDQGDGGELAAAVRRTIAAHHQLGHLAELDAGKCAIALELCNVAVTKRVQRRLSTVSNDLRLLSELLDSMTPANGDVDGKLEQAMREWEQHLQANGAPTEPTP